VYFSFYLLDFIDGPGDDSLAIKSIPEIQVCQRKKEPTIKPGTFL
jgi:hypothetical protein